MTTRSNKGLSGFGLSASIRRYTALQWLQQANTDEANDTFNANTVNDIFSGINQNGDIS